MIKVENGPSIGNQAFITRYGQLNIFLGSLTGRKMKIEVFTHSEFINGFLWPHMHGMYVVYCPLSRAKVVSVHFGASRCLS